MPLFDRLFGKPAPQTDQAHNDDPFLKAHIEETQELLAKVQAAARAVTPRGDELDFPRIATDTGERLCVTAGGVQLQLSLVGFELFQDDEIDPAVPEVDFAAHEHAPISERVEYRSTLRRKLAYFRNYDNTITCWHAVFEQICAGLLRFVPKGYRRAEGISFDIPLIDALDNVPEVLMHSIIFPLLDGQASQHKVFVNARKTLEANITLISGEGKDPLMPNNPKFADMPPREMVAAYLGGTPLLSLFTDSIVTLTIPEHVWHEAAWCLAPPGTGKSQLIQYLVSERLDQIENGECSVIVMDSQGDLINQMRSLKCLAPGQPLHDKLIIVEPDLDYPPALNLFDFGRDRIVSYSENDREKFTNIAITQMTYVLNALMGDAGALTPKQETLYRYVLRLLMELPEATLETFSDLLQITKPKELDAYQEYIARLHQPAQDFFANQFIDGEFSATKKQVAWRISNLRENTYFDRMFSHPKSKLDLFAELNSSKLILIDTSKERLGEDGTNVFGRYFIGALLSASQERASLDRAERVPVFCYIDECQDYIATDAKIATLLDQARKMKISMFLAHQRCRQIQNPNVLDALSNTSIKFVSTDNANDEAVTARALHTSREFVGSQPEQHFALYVRRHTPTAVSVKVPFLVIEEMEKMTPTDQDEVRAVMRCKYSTHFDAPAGDDQLELGFSEEDTQTPKQNTKSNDPDNPPIQPSTDW